MSEMAHVLNEAIFQGVSEDSTSQKSELKRQIQVHQCENILLICIFSLRKHLKLKRQSRENELRLQGLQEFCISHLNITV